MAKPVSMCVSDAAKIMGVSVQRVYQLCRASRLGAWKDKAGDWRVPEANVQRWKKGELRQRRGIGGLHPDKRRWIATNAANARWGKAAKA